jgi:DNA-binding transcriptional LysR family regulator
MDRLDSIAAFVAVCDANGFASAARRLGVSPSVVTRQVAALEDHLGVLLLQRTTRSLRLTEAGERYLDRARRILSEIEAAELSAQGETEEPRGKLSVSAPLLFGRMHVAPVLSRYMQAYPRVTAELNLTDRIVNLIEEGHDLAIRIGQLPDSQLIARRLGETRRVIVASPDYLKMRGTPGHPTDLASFDTIAFTGLVPTFDWRFVEDGRDVRVRVTPRYATNSGDAAIGYATEGGGLTVALSYQVHEAIAREVLVEVLGAFAPPPLPIQALYPSSRLLSSKVRAFVNLIEKSADWHLS